MSVNSKHRTTGCAVDRVNRDIDDFYPTPPSAVHALLDVEKFEGSIWEPACGEGHISKCLLKRYPNKDIFSSDLIARGFGSGGYDFLSIKKTWGQNIITNPPFKLATEFIRHSIAIAPRKTALLMRIQVLEGMERGKIFAVTPPARVYVFSDRLSMFRKNYTGKGTGLLCFAWYVWERGYVGSPLLKWL